MDELDAIRDDILKGIYLVEGALVKLKALELPQPDTRDEFEDVKEKISVLQPALKFFAETLHEIRILSAEHELKLWIGRLAQQKINEDYKHKLGYVRQWNETLRGNDVAIAHPETGEPCLLLAVTSYDKEGRYTLESRQTKKRSGSYKSFADIPIKLVPDLPRKIPIAERRKKQAAEKPPKKGKKE